MNDQHQITENGIIVAAEILVRDGFFKGNPSGSHADLFAAKAACRKYIEASVAKGDARSEQDCADAVLIAYFEAYLEDVTRKIN
jgi:hypothetical protein